MNPSTRSDWGKLLLRLTVGGLLLFHGVAKAQHGVDGIANMLAGRGLPGALAYGAYVGELLAPLCLIAGVLVVPAALFIAATMGIAIYTAHMGDLLSIGDFGQWAVETPAFYLLSALAVALLGPGRFALRRKDA